MKKLLDLDIGRRTDLAVFARKSMRIVLFCEVSEEHFSSNTDHKDFSKINSLLTVSCIRLAEYLASEGLDPSMATFGVLVGNSSFQLSVAHPVFSPIKNTDQNEIRIDISTNLHWYCDFNGAESAASTTCSSSCCI